MITKAKQNRSVFIYIALAVYWVILFAATSLPGQELPKTGINDKIEHFSAYAILSFLLYLTFSVQEKYKLLSKHPILSTLIVAAFYGMLDELHQLFVPGRDCDINDFIADSIGILLGLIIVTRVTLKTFFMRFFLKNESI